MTKNGNEHRTSYSGGEQESQPTFAVDKYGNAYFAGGMRIIGNLQAEDITFDDIAVGDLTVSGNLAVAGNLSFGTSPSINSTTSRIEQIDGVEVGTWTAGSLTMRRNSGDLAMSLVTTVSGVADVGAKGFTAGTNPATDAAGAGASLALVNLNATAGNFTRIRGADSTQTATSVIALINDSHTTHAGSIQMLTANSSGTLVLGLTIDNTQTLVLTSTGILKTSTALTDYSALATGSLGNAPVAGNPTKWAAINDNGTRRLIPMW